MKLISTFLALLTFLLTPVAKAEDSFLPLAIVQQFRAQPADGSINLFLWRAKLGSYPVFRIFQVAFDESDQPTRVTIFEFDQNGAQIPKRTKKEEDEVFSGKIGSYNVPILVRFKDNKMSVSVQNKHAFSADKVKKALYWKRQQVNFLNTDRQEKYWALINEVEVGPKVHF